MGLLCLSNETTHLCCLAVMSCANDLSANPSTNIAQLLTFNKHAILKNVPADVIGIGAGETQRNIFDYSVKR